VPPLSIPPFVATANATMADSLLGDLGLQDALKYVHVNIFPSVVLLVRDCSMVLVTSATCVSAPPSIAPRKPQKPPNEQKSKLFLSLPSNRYSSRSACPAP